MVGILFLFILLQTPYYLMDIPTLQPEFIWKLLGQQIKSGDLLYVAIIDNTGPFSAIVYWLNGTMFSNSWLSFRIIASVILFFQVFYANHMLIENNAYDESNYLPAFIMLLLYQLSFDFMTLSPALMGSTFVLLALSKLLSQTSVNTNTVPSVLLMGIYAGTAFCFHFPYLLFLPLLIFSGLLINGFSFQQLALILTAFLLPTAFCALFFFWHDALPNFIELYFTLAFKLDKIYHVSFKDLSYIYFLPLIIAIMGYLKNNILRRLTVNQQKQNHLFMLFLLLNISMFFLMDRVSPFQFISIVPVLAYFITHFFSIAKTKLAQNVLGYSLLLIIPLIGYSWTFYLLNDNSFSKYKLENSATHAIPDGEKVMVLGSDLAPYQNTNMASPYLNFRLTEIYFDKMGERKRKIRFYQDLKKEQPEIIIDEAGVFDEWIDDLPKIKPLYSKSNIGLIYRGNQE